MRTDSTKTINSLGTYQPTSKASNQSSVINRLPHDCLITIFQCLPIHERIEFEQVCKQWKEKLSKCWCDIKQLDFRESVETTDYDKLPKNYRNHGFIRRLLMRCGRYLTVLRITISDDTEILEFITSHCPNLIKLEITAGNEGCDISKIDLERFPLLRGLSLVELSVDRILLNALHKKTLTHLFLAECKVPKEIELTPYFLNLKHLQYLDLSNLYNHVDDDFLGILVVNCMKITLLDISGCIAVTDEGINHLRNLYNLRVFSMQRLSPRVTDVFLSELTNLEILNCCDCESIADTGIIELIEYAHSLRYLNLVGTAVTSETLKAAGKLKKRRTNEILQILVDSDVELDGWGEVELSEFLSINHSLVKNEPFSSNAFFLHNSWKYSRLI